MIEQLITTWEELLAEQVGTLEQLTEVLQDEREAIITFDLLQITAVTRRKETLLNQIQAFESSRRAVTVRLGVALALPGMPGNHALVSALPDSAAAQRIRHQLSCVKSLAQAVMELNESQRRFVAHSLVDVEQSLALIHSLQGATAGAYYNKEGVMGAGLVGRSQAMNQTI